MMIAYPLVICGCRVLITCNHLRGHPTTSQHVFVNSQLYTEQHVNILLYILALNMAGHGPMALRN